jgi:hypothetical protein
MAAVLRLFDAINPETSALDLFRDIANYKLAIAPILQFTA